VSQVPFAIQQEAWNVYRLEDGTEIRARIILVGVVRKEGEYHENGAPAYEIQAQQLTHVASPAVLYRSQVPTTETKQ
jgi:hypothetical protein